MGAALRNYMIRRVGHSIFIVAGLMGLLFFAINILGDPVSLLVDEDAPQEAIDALREKFGFDRPLHVRFADFYWDLVRGDFGTSLRHRIDAREMIFDRLPNTIALALVAWGIGSIGIPLGMLAARRPRGLTDRFVNILSFAVISIPEFWLALMLILLIAVQFNLLPTSGFGGLGPAGWKFMILPAIALSPRVMGRNAQITRATMIEEISKQYVATARSKGLAESRILYGHVLKNAAISIVTLMGDELAGFMNGSTVVEIIFGWPGLGKLLIDAINSRDLPVVTASVFVIALMVMFINLMVDLVYTWLDPRISYS
jgi:peptide/nickel transport system permease protein